MITPIAALLLTRYEWRTLSWSLALYLGFWALITALVCLNAFSSSLIWMTFGVNLRHRTLLSDFQDCNSKRSLLSALSSVCWWNWALVCWGCRPDICCSLCNRFRSHQAAMFFSRCLDISVSLSLDLYLSISLSLYFSISLSFYLSISLSLSLYLSISLSLPLSFSISIPLYISISLSLYLYFLYLYLCMCLCVSVCEVGLWIPTVILSCFRRLYCIFHANSLRGSSKQTWSSSASWREHQLRLVKRHISCRKLQQIALKIETICKLMILVKEFCFAQTFTSYGITTTFLLALIKWWKFEIQRCCKTEDIASSTVSGWN